MRVQTAILLILISLPASAADVLRDVPDQFLGDWCTQPQPDEEDTGESDIRIAAHEIGYYRDSAKILSAVAAGDQLALIVRLHEEGRTWLATHEFELSGDGKQLTSLLEDGQIRRRIKCHPSSTTPLTIHSSRNRFAVRLNSGVSARTAASLPKFD